MRRILEFEAKAAALALARIPKAERMRIFALWVHQADWAHKIHKRTGAPHPVWGNGSLYQAMHFQAEEQFDYSNLSHCDALGSVLDMLMKRSQTNLITP